MNLTNTLRNRVTKFQRETDTSLADIHRAIYDKGHDISYVTLSQFVNGHTESTGRHLNAIDAFLNRKGY